MPWACGSRSLSPPCGGNPFRSTKQVLDEHLFLQRRLRRKVFALIRNRKAPSWDSSQDGAFLLSAHSISAIPPATMIAERNRRLYEWRDLSPMNARGRSMSWLETIHQICDLREPLTFHNDKSTDHGFLGEAPPPGCRSGQREVQAAEKLVVKHGSTLGCEQRHILNDFLKVDSGQPLSGWFSLKSILPKRGSAFYTI